MANRPRAIILDTSLQQADGPGTDAFAFAFPAELFGSGGLDADVLYRTADGASEVLAHSLAVRADFGFLAGDGAVGIYELISELPRILHHLGK